MTKKLLPWAIVLYLAEFILFKLIHAYASFCVDSIEYLYAAHWSNPTPAFRSLGYSKMLWLFNLFSNSDLLLVSIQYLILQAGRLYFLLSILYLFNLSGPRKYILVTFFLLDPMPLYLANYILSDSIFTALSYFWLGTLFWIIYRPSWGLLASNVLLLVMLLFVRFNALYYPLCSILAIGLSRWRFDYKCLGIALNFCFVGIFMLFTIRSEYSYTFNRQFSSFAGWQVANNALTMYQNLKPSARYNIPVKFRVLDSMVRWSIDSQGTRFPIGADYMWNSASPLTRYAIYDWKEKTAYGFYESFHREASFYGEYGTLLIRQHPVEFLKFWLLPNSVYYFESAADRLAYNLHPPDSMTHNIKGLHQPLSFQYSFPLSEVEVAHAIDWYPYFQAVVNISMLLMSIAFLFFKKAAEEPIWRQHIIWIMLLFCLLNMGFSIYASMIYLRYQIFPISIAFVFSILGSKMLDFKK
jgi:hypothetical protein